MAEVDEVFKALSDPTRIKIVEMLAENGELCVCRIYERLEMTQPAVSHHLAVLKHAGLVRARRDGQWIHYSLNREALSGVALDFVRGLLEKLDSAPARMEVCAK
ncbi:MAG: metalloregulator ArsR/SmtB family transcription factor [Armatimonadetes bacterium]|nr:metalloregulator ArsR/SmtB family transcription factor [Armatimonadota bacterium]